MFNKALNHGDGIIAPVSTFKNKMKLIGVTLLLILSIVGNIVLFFNTRDVSASSTSIVDQIQKIAELSVLKHNYTAVSAFKSSKDFYGFSLPLTSKSFLVRFEGYVKAGVDLEDVKVDISKDNKELKIRLKNSKILDKSVDLENAYVYDESESLFNHITIEESNEEIAKEQKKMEEKILEDGIIEQANERVKELIVSFFGNAGFEKVDVVFE